MIIGPRLKSVPFQSFSKSFLPKATLIQAGFVTTSDMPYERENATKTTHQEFFKVKQSSLFGSDVQKILRLDSLRERFIISETEKGRGQCVNFIDIKSIETDESNPIHVTIVSENPQIHQISFTMENLQITQTFIRRLETLVQALKMGTR